MRRILAAIVAMAVLIGVSAPAARAGGSTDAALGLASFAVFNQIVGPLLRPHPHRATVVRRDVVYQQVVAPPPTVVYAAPPAPAYPTVVQYPHGRYELRLDGPQYVWVWVPAVPPPPPPPAP